MNRTDIGIKGLLSTLNKEGREIYTINDIIAITGITKNYAWETVSRLEKSGRLIRLERGKYLYVPEGFEDNWTGNSSLIASSLVKPYAIAYWSALNCWHYTEQISSTVFIQTTSRKMHRSQDILGVKYQFVTVKQKKFFGLATIWEKQHKICVTGREKTIIDCLDYPEYCGGVEEALKGIKTGLYNKELDIRKLMSYSRENGNRTVIKRLGYILEILSTAVSKSQLEELRSNISKGYSLLDPTLQDKGKISRRWGLKINANLA